MLGNGFYKPRSSDAGTPAVREVNPTTQFCFAMEIRGLAKLILGNNDGLRGIEGEGKC